MSLNTFPNALEEFKVAPGWSAEWGLPLGLPHFNPHLYGAYCTRCLGGGWIMLYGQWAAYRQACTILPGLYYRFPDGREGYASHDEIVGIGWLSPSAALAILMYLQSTDGQYPAGSNNYYYRFIWLVPYLRARAGMATMPVTWWSQIQWSLPVLWDGLWYTKAKAESRADFSGRLRIWMMIDAMKEYQLCRIVCEWWASRMERVGLTPKVCFRTYLAEITPLAKYAPDKWIDSVEHAPGPVRLVS